MMLQRSEECVTERFDIEVLRRRLGQACWQELAITSCRRPIGEYWRSDALRCSPMNARNDRPHVVATTEPRVATAPKHIPFWDSSRRLEV